MAAFAVHVDARCPLCGTPILAIDRGGRVMQTEDLHPVPLYRNHGAQGYMLCDDCGVLAELPADITLN